jgi:SNF family Na+-dependent transporter
MSYNDIVSFIIDWENGTASAKDTVDFFARMVKDGTAWKLQGCYGRMAAHLIENGYISTSGEVLRYPSGDN